MTLSPCRQPATPPRGGGASPPHRRSTPRCRRHQPTTQVESTVEGGQSGPSAVCGVAALRKVSAAAGVRCERDDAPAEGAARGLVRDLRGCKSRSHSCVWRCKVDCSSHGQLFGGQRLLCSVRAMTVVWLTGANDFVLLCVSCGIDRLTRGTWRTSWMTRSTSRHAPASSAGTAAR